MAHQRPEPEICHRGPTAWLIDDVCPRRDAPQCCGVLGKRTNCQVAVCVRAVTNTASRRLQWRYLCPKSEHRT
ncbi:transposase [Streptomyces sp. NPDC005322]|uniref:transposase n=1 Tax=Streptomyces sp. NPDC005322 TaxID=3157032 RepID=UPI0033A06FE2